MNQNVGIIAIVVGVVLGVVGARMLNDAAPDSAGSQLESPDPERVRDTAVQIAEEILVEQEAQHVLAQSDEEDVIIKSLEVFAPQVEDLKGAMIRVADTLVVMEEHAQRPVQKSEMDVRRVAHEVLEPSRLGQLFATSREPGVRIDAITVLLRVAADDPQALKTIVSLVDDPDDRVRSSAISSLSRFLGRSSSTDESRIVALGETGLEQTVSRVFYSEQEGKLKSSALQLLTAMKSASVAPYWQERFDKGSGRPARQVSAAKALKNLGQSAPFDQLLNEAISNLQDSDRRKSGEAARILRTLGGDEARMALETLRKN